MNTALMFSSKTCKWATPEGFAEKYGPFDLDPCASEENARAAVFYTESDDGLSKPWVGRVWMNPPYGRTIGKWVEKAYREVEKGNAIRVVCLLPARTDTKWWHEFCMEGKIEFIRGRLKFNGHANSAPFPSAVVTFERTYACDGCETPNLAIGDDCTTNRVGACLCFDCLRMMDENERALWDDAFDFRNRVAEVLG